MIPKVSAKYIVIGEIEINFEVEEIIEEGPFEIYSLEDLINFRDLQNSGGRDFSSEDVYLMTDIDLASIENWTPIGTEEFPFSGTFYGNSYTISNMQIDAEDDNIGFFGVNSGIITDLKVTGSINTQGECTGGIVGLSLGGEILNCINYADVSGSEHVGGICGHSLNTIIDSCGNEGHIESSNGYVGGIVRIH